MVSMIELKADWRKIPNLVTIARLALCPFPGIIVLIYQNNAFMCWVAVALFVAVAATDLLDGYLARRLDEVTSLGKMLDPAVDKALIIITLFWITFIYPLVWLPLSIIMLRETSVTKMRTRAKRQCVTIAAVTSGKVKMVLQTIATALLLTPLQGPWHLLQAIAMTIAIASTIISWYDYYLRFSDCKENA